MRTAESIRPRAPTPQNFRFGPRRRISYDNPNKTDNGGHNKNGPVAAVAQFVDQNLAKRGTRNQSVNQKKEGQSEYETSHPKLP